MKKSTEKQCWCLLTAGAHSPLTFWRQPNKLLETGCAAQLNILLLPLSLMCTRHHPDTERDWVVLKHIWIQQINKVDSNICQYQKNRQKAFQKLKISPKLLKEL